VFILTSDYSGKQQLRTPPVTSGNLEGVTRDCVLQIARDMDVECVERDLSLFDLYSADEAFLTGTAAEVVAMTKLDSRIIGNGEVGQLTRRINQKYRELTHNEGEPVF